MTSKVKPNEGDWICQGKTFVHSASGGACGNVNFSGRNKCNKCNAEMQKDWVYKKTGIEIGKQQADKSGGLFNADDWMCKSCGNINWARRVKCNVCNSSKIAKAESRTGLGGGYKDRDDVVEYKERAESDDEFDEFGLKKKKFRGQSVATGAAAGDGEKEEKIDENENNEKASGDVAVRGDESESESNEGEGEEEEEDDGDLDKYNLLDEDDVEDLVDNKKKPSRERSESSGSSSSSSSEDESSDDESSGSSSGGEGDQSSGSDSEAASSDSSSSHSNGPDRHHKPREEGHNRKERNRSRSRSPIDKNGRKDKYQSRR